MSEDHQTDRAPPPSGEDTPPVGYVPQTTQPATALSPEAMSSLLLRLTLAVEAQLPEQRAMSAELRAMRADLRIVLEEGRSHAARLTALERRLAEMPCQRGADCTG